MFSNDVKSYTGVSVKVFRLYRKGFFVLKSSKHIKEAKKIKRNQINNNSGLDMMDFNVILAQYFHFTKILPKIFPKIVITYSSIINISGDVEPQTRFLFPFSCLYIDNKVMALR